MNSSRDRGREPIPLSRPHRSAHELGNLEAVLRSGHAHGDGPFTRRATSWLRETFEVPSVLLTTSCTHALEMATRLLGIGHGDEVILPSFTFPSAANAVALAGATCVFVDVDPATGNADPTQIAEAIGPKTKAISIMHYGGMPADLASIQEISKRSGLPVIEDNAHGLGVRFGDRVLGSFGAFGTQSFHDTKNIHCGEGGALLVNDPRFIEASEIFREKGTNRSQFLRGQVDKYSWADLGSSYLMSEFNAAVLTAQLSEFAAIQRERFAIWNRYAAELAQWADDHAVRLMDPPGGVHAAHLFFLVMPTRHSQDRLLTHLRSWGIGASFHYVPLHASPAGRRFGRTLHELGRTEDFSERLVRLPLWPGMSRRTVTRVINAVTDFVVE